MKLRGIRIAVFCLFSVLIGGCFSLIEDGDWVELTEKDALAKLSVHFVVTPEMKVVGGQVRTLGGLLDDQYEWYVYFTLPDNMAPEDWLSYLNQEAPRTKQKTLHLEKISKYRYCDYSYRVDECADELVYRESEKRYHFYHYYAN